MTRLMLAFLSMLAAAPTGVAQVRAPGEDRRVPVLAELFTAEGCSSCPPADRLLAMVAKEQPVEGAYVIVLSEHVTYWDNRGWKDPFGSPRFTERQNKYGYRFNLDSVFTPQLVIDGRIQMVGSDADQFRKALSDAVRTPKPELIVEATFDEKGAVVASASGPGLQAGFAESAELLWAITEDDLIVDVTRGENAKRRLEHSGVVRTLIARKIDSRQMPSATAVIRLEPDWKRASLRVVAFVQSTKSGRVLSAGWSKLPAPH
jgi:hypothetical protein